jgi:hypothetical protein
MRTLFSIAMNLILAWGCAHYAKSRGRNPTTWLIAGIFFGIFALVTLFILPVRRVVAASRTSTAAAPKVVPVLRVISPLHAEKLWYYLDEQKKQFGPMSFHALSAAWGEGAVREQTFVWNEEMENWQRFKDVIALPQ